MTRTALARAWSAFRRPARRALAAVTLLAFGACSGGGGTGGGGPTNPTASIVLSVSPNAIGINSSADITVQALGDGGAALSGASVQLSTTLGNLLSTALVTGSDGRAATQLRGDGRIGSATVTARLAANGATAQQIVRIGQGVRITLRVDPDAISGDGTAQIFGIVTHLDGTQTPAGVAVDFATTLGRLSDTRPRTDNAGTVHIQLHGDGRSGTAVISATTAEAVETARIEVTIGGSSQLSLQAVPIAIPRDGRAVLIAEVRDGDGRPVPGVAVILSTTRGRIEHPTPQTNTLGQAITNLLAEGAQGRARVTAQAVTATRTIDVDIGQGLTLVLRASPPSVPSNGATTLTLLATTADRRAVPIGTEVTFSTTLGHLVVERAIVDETGLATTVLRSEGIRGTAQVTARVTGFSETVTLGVPIL